MKLHRSYTPEELRYLSMLSRMYPTVRAAGTRGTTSPSTG